MKLRSINLDADEDPSTIVVEMTVNEAALITSLVGSLSPKKLGDATNNDSRWTDALEEIYGCLTGSFFNRFYDDGVNEVAPRGPKIEALRS